MSPMMIVSSLTRICDKLAVNDGGQLVVGGMYKFMRVISVVPEIITMACCSVVLLLS